MLSSKNAAVRNWTRMVRTDMFKETRPGSPIVATGRKSWAPRPVVPPVASGKFVGARIPLES